MLLVQGMSGAGKTSLFKAGLLPLLDLRPVEGIAQWITVSLRPSESDPSMRELGALGVLASRLSERVPAIARIGSGVRKLAEALHARPEEAVAMIATCAAADADRANIDPRRVRLLIYVDQLEEAFTLPDSSRHGGIAVRRTGGARALADHLGRGHAAQRFRASPGGPSRVHAVPRPQRLLHADAAAFR